MVPGVGCGACENGARVNRSRGSAQGGRGCRRRGAAAALLVLAAVLVPEGANTLGLGALGSSSGSMAFAHGGFPLVSRFGGFQAGAASVPGIGGGVFARGLGRGVQGVPVGSGGLVRQGKRSVDLQMGAKGAIVNKGTEVVSQLIPSIALKQALLPIILVVVLCILAAIPLGPSISTPDPTLNPDDPNFPQQTKLKKALGLQRRVFTSVMLGALVTTWIFSGTWAFALVMGWVGSLALGEYFSLAEAANECRPAKKCGILATCAFILTACGTAYGLPFAYTDAVLPITYVVILGYLLTKKRTVKLTIADVQTTFMGIFYIGYLSSFWVRLRALGMIPSAQVYGMIFSSSNSIFSKFPMWFNPDVFTQGAIVTWWTMISIASSDVGAYFSGKNFGKTKLSDWIGITISPNKTKEGFIGGVILCSCFATTGAHLMKWPWWWVTGPVYGFMISSLGLLGDLTVSLFKRDAGVKDTGTVLPGHGGLLDRIDSYMLTAAPVYFFVKFISQWGPVP